MKKKFKLKNEEIIELIPEMGGCYATDKILIEGLKVGYMYREKQDYENDSGWIFMSGTESQDYIDELTNTGIYEVNTIANYDKEIIPYLDMPIGTELKRNGNSFELVNPND